MSNLNNVVTVQETNIAVVQALGARGPQGASILTGAGSPTSNLGIKGDYYIDSVSHLVYGPKTSDSVWNYTPVINLSGTNGLSFLTGTGAPSPSFGNNGDTYLNTLNGDLYKKSSPSNGSAGTWSKTTNIIQVQEISFTFEQQSNSKGGRTPADGGTGDGGWYVYHNLGYKPAIYISDYSGNNVECDIEHVGVNLTILTFSTGISGYAYCS